MLAGILIAVVAIGATVLLVRYLSVSGTGRTLALSVLLVLAALVAMFVSSYTSIYYRKPFVWIVATVISWLVVLAVAGLIASDVKWRPTRLLAIFGLLVASAVAFALLAMSAPSVGTVFPHEVAAKQIGEAYGFVTILPAELMMSLDSKPVSALQEPDKGLQVSYEQLTIEERKATGKTAEELAALVAAGTRPFFGAEPIGSDAVTSTPDVGGFQGVAVEYSYAPKGPDVGQLPTMSMTFLAFEKDGVEVRMYSQGNERRVDGKWVPLPSRPVEELADIARTMAPVD